MRACAGRRPRDLRRASSATSLHTAGGSRVTLRRDGPAPFAVAVAQTTRDRERQLHRLVAYSVAPQLALLLLLGGWLWRRWASDLAPLARLQRAWTGATRATGAGRTEAPSRDLQRLAHAVNALLSASSTACARSASSPATWRTSCARRWPASARWPTTAWRDSPQVWREQLGHRGEPGAREPPGRPAAGAGAGRRGARQPAARAGVASTSWRATPCCGT